MILFNLRFAFSKRKAFLKARPRSSEKELKISMVSEEK